LLASHLTPNRYTKDAQTLMEKAERRAGKMPKVVVTDRLRSYLDAIERTFRADARHHQSGPFALTQSTRSIERLHGTIKDRTKIMRGLANKESAKLVMDGWAIHYNFFRPHQAHKGKTPAEVAGASAPFKSWADVVKGQE
jgi:putative transposase